MGGARDPEVSVVVPVFNEAAVLPELQRRLQAVLASGRAKKEAEQEAAREALVRLTSIPGSQFPRTNE